MEKALLKILYDKVCLSLGTSCTGCPFWPVREELGAACCTDFIEDYPKEAALALARFIAGDVALNKLAGPQTKNPETRREILQAAERCVCGDRDQDYGGPEDSFALIARLWEPIIAARCLSTDTDVTVDAVTVALLMAELKIARAATNKGHMDSWVDAAGYAACGGEIAADKEARHNGD